MVSLAKGQTISLEKKGGGSLTAVTMGLGWDMRQSKKGILGGLFGGGGGAIDLDASCIAFAADRTVVDTVFFGQLKSKCGSIVHTGDNLTGAGEGDDEQIKVDLGRVPAGVAALVFTVSSFRGDTFDRIENAFCRLVDDGTGQEAARVDLSESGSHTGLIMAKVVRQDNGGWSMTAIGEKVGSRVVKDLTDKAAAHV
jgi:tellurium resistance protein TerZ